MVALSVRLWFLVAVPSLLVLEGCGGGGGGDKEPIVTDCSVYNKDVDTLNKYGTDCQEQIDGGWCEKDKGADKNAIFPKTKADQDKCVKDSDESGCALTTEQACPCKCGVCTEECKKASEGGGADAAATTASP